MSGDPNSAPRHAPVDFRFLQLLHLADSALPIGSLAHSFGLETLVSVEMLQTVELETFLRGYLEEAGFLEAVACREAFQLISVEVREFPAAQWIALNALLSALKPARESRAASATLGRNFLRAVIGLANHDVLRQAWEASLDTHSAIHQSVAFGLAGAVLGFEESRTVTSMLHQMTANLVSACQRLLPLGQSEAMRILWNLKPLMAEVAAQSHGRSLETASCTMPLLDWGAMEHPALGTRLFVS
ncbi:MAG TPA: urease accessory UreF family protein [Candidatus Eisenbacteria bacterium]|nr:urease accessory UreF family protein [Candidatus Eisenbacteria bacterium]